MSTAQTVAITVAVGAVAIAGYKYYQRKRAERIMKKALGEFADELEKVFGGSGFQNEPFDFTGFGRR